LNDFLNEIYQIVRMEASIVERIDEDLDLQAKRKNCFDSSTNSSWRARLVPSHQTALTILQQGSDPLRQN
jgi:hypothetical protein